MACSHREPLAELNKIDGDPCQKSELGVKMQEILKMPQSSVSFRNSASDSGYISGPNDDNSNNYFLAFRGLSDEKVPAPPAPLAPVSSEAAAALPDATRRPDELPPCAARSGLEPANSPSPAIPRVLPGRGAGLWRKACLDCTMTGATALRGVTGDGRAPTTGFACIVMPEPPAAARPGGGTPRGSLAADGTGAMERRESMGLWPWRRSRDPEPLCSGTDTSGS